MTTRAEWSKRLKRWEKSGQSIEAFAKAEGIPVKQLKWWRWCLGCSPAEVAAATPPRFLPVRVVEAQTPPLATASSTIEVALPNGRVVRVTPGFDSSTLERVITIASESGPC
jgi:transposase